jgi:hypothetical protein
MAQGQCYQHLQRRVHGRPQCNSYRPITVLPVIDKLFAAVLTERLNKTFTPHDHQSAFRKGHSTLDPLLAFTAREAAPA